MSAAQIATWTQDAVMAAFCASVLFLAGVTALFPWWQSLAGRSLVLIDGCWAGSLLLSFLDMTGIYHAPEMWQGGWIAAWLCITAAVTVWRLWALAVVHRRGQTLLRKMLRRQEKGPRAVPDDRGADDDLLG